jgi:glycosyltransferase involved in cell wall biosynthesis
VRLAVMTPTYNERENIDEFLARVSAAVPTADIFVVDDASPDGTGHRVGEQAALDPRVHLMTRTGERGYAAACREGLATVASRGYDAVVTIDCDLSHDPIVITTMVQHIEAGADVVIGSRYVRGGQVQNWSIYRRLLSRLGNLYTGFMLGLNVRDCTSGFRAYRGAVILDGTVGTTIANGYAFLSEVLLRLRQTGSYHIVETPITYTDRRAGESKMDKTIIGESMRLVTVWGLRRMLRRR